MSLQDPSLRASKQIVAASNNSPALRSGSEGGGVQLLQAALIDLGYRMPRSTRKTGRPDGKYGRETIDVVSQFQERYGLKGDGVAGRRTIARLDRELAGKGRSHPKSAPRTIAHQRVSYGYRVGHGDPKVPMDPPRPHGEVAKTTRGYLIWRALRNHTMGGGGTVGVVFGPDAAATMRHYLENTGLDYEVRFRNLVAENRDVRDGYRDAIDQAQKFVEQLPVGNHNITSLACTTYTATDTNNWALAVGGLNAWSKGKAIVKEDGTGRSYELFFEFQFKDRYNFDKGKGFGVVPVPDAIPPFDIPLMEGEMRVAGRERELEVRDTLLLRLHEEGRAKEFVTFGSFIKHLSWRHGQHIPWDMCDPLRH